MKSFEWNAFEGLDTKRERDQDHRNGIWLLRHSGSQNEQVIVFIHGLWGHPVETWGNFPRFAFEDLPAFDIALYGYSTPLNMAVPLVRKPRLQEYARSLRRTVWENLIVQTGYREVAFVCHSLGGVLVKTCTAQIEDEDPERDDYMPRLHSVFYFGTPHFGSDRVHWWNSWGSPLLGCLRANARELERVRNFWRYRVATDPADRRKRRILIHARGVYSDKDFWVNAESALGELDPNHVYPYRVRHRELVKPQAQTDGHYKYFLSQLMQIDEMRKNGLKFIP